MATIKQRRITKIVREFVKTQDSYDITGVDLALSKFFYRASQELFQDLSTGDYRVDTSAGKQTLVITNQEILSAAEAFQVGYVLDFTATKYETQWNVDINTLKDRYNQLVDNTQELWEYIRKTGFISDDTTMDLILPQLDNEQLWYFADGVYKGLSLADFRDLGERLIEAYVEFQKSVIELMLRNARENIEMTRDNGIKEIQGLLNALNLNIDNFTGTKKVELQKIINDFRASLEGIAIGNAHSLGGIAADKYQLKQDNELQTVAKTVVGAINELNEDVVDLNDAIDELEVSKVGAEDTIASLKASSKYKLGDVVEVLGFHAKGDGSHHKRIAKAEDDGSGEQGQGGIWWCIVHDGEVNVSWFGMKVDDAFDNTNILNDVFSLVRNELVSKINFDSGEYRFFKSINATQLNNNLRDVILQGTGSNYGNTTTRGTILKFVRRTQVELDENKFGIELTGSSAIKFRDIGIVGNINTIGVSSPNVLILQQRDNVNQECKHHTWENVRIMTGYGWNFSTNNWKPRADINEGYGIIGLYNNAGEDNLYTDCVFYGESPIFFTVTNILNFEGKYCTKLADINYGRYSCGRNNFEHCIVNSYNGPAYVIDGVNFLRSISCYTSTFGNAYAIKNIGLPSRFIEFKGMFEDCHGLLEINTTLNNASYPFVYNIKFNDVVMSAGTKWVSAFKNLSNVRFGNIEFSGSLTSMSFYIAENDNDNIIENIRVNLFSYDGVKYPFECTNTNLKNIYWNCGGSVTGLNFTNWVKSKCKSYSNINFNSSSDSGYLAGIGGLTNVFENTSLGKLSNPSLVGSRILDCNTVTVFLSYFDGTSLNKPPLLGSGIIITLYTNIDKGKAQIAIANNGVSKLSTRSQNITTGVWSIWTDSALYSQLDTPYYAYKMQQEGIYAEYVAYRDELHEYENSQTTDETMLLPVLHEPEIPQSVKVFAEKYKLI